MVKAFTSCPEIPKIELSEAKDNIVFQLVNTEQDREMLADVPHREYQDLSVIYRWVVKVEMALTSFISSRSIIRISG